MKTGGVDPDRLLEVAVETPSRRRREMPKMDSDCDGRRRGSCWKEVEEEGEEFRFEPSSKRAAMKDPADGSEGDGEDGVEGLLEKSDDLPDGDGKLRDRFVIVCRWRRG